MPDYKHMVIDLLERSGAQLVRTKKHPIYRLPDGRTWPIPATPSDHRSWINSYYDIRNMLGIGPRKNTRVQSAEERKARKLIKQADRPAFSSLEPFRLNVENQLDFGAKLGLAATNIFPESKDPHYESYIHKAPRKVRSEPTERHGQVRSIPSDIIEKANKVGVLEGDEARENYLKKMYMEIDRIPQQLRNKNEDVQEELSMNFMGMLDIAKKRLVMIDVDIENANKRIALAQQEIEQKQKIKQQAQAAMEQMEIAALGFKDLEPLLVADEQSRYKKTMTTKRRAGGAQPPRDGIPSVGKIVDQIEAFLLAHRDNAYGSKEILAYVNTVAGFEKVDNKAIFTALSYGKRDNRRNYDAIERGLYKYVDKQANGAATPPAQATPVGEAKGAAAEVPATPDTTRAA